MGVARISKIRDPTSFTLWVTRCDSLGYGDKCVSRTERPKGSGGRCELKVSEAVSCVPVARILEIRDPTAVTLWVTRCDSLGNGDKCVSRTEWPKGSGGRCELKVSEAVSCVPVA